MKPCLSIGLPVFNGENYLVETLESLLAQTFTDFELIVSDNASTDGTEAIVKQFQAKDQRVKYFRNETNMGGAYNDRRVFELSQGKYFRWAGHDDLCDPTLVEKCIAVLDQHPDVVLCYAKAIIIDQNGNFVEHYVDGFDLRMPEPHLRLRYVIGENRLLNPFYGVIRSDMLRTTKLVENYAASDRVLLGELALRGRFHELPEYLFKRRIHPKKSTSSNTSDEAIAVWFDPKLSQRVLAPRWRRFFGFLGAIARSPLNVMGKLLCYLEFVKFYLSPIRAGGAGRDFSQAFRAFRARVVRKFAGKK